MRSTETIELGRRVARAMIIENTGRGRRRIWWIISAWVVSTFEAVGPQRNAAGGLNAAVDAHRRSTMIRDRPGEAGAVSGFRRPLALPSTSLDSHICRYTRAAPRFGGSGSKARHQCVGSQSD